MRIDAFLSESPMFAINLASRRFETLTARLLQTQGIGFMEGLVLTAIFFEAPQPVKPSLLAETFQTSRGNVSHCVSSLEAKGFLQRRIDPEDARAYQLTLKAQGRRCALQVIATFDKLQKQFEDEIGKAALRQAVDVVRRLKT